ncbi:hypothetical protein D3C76_1251090 [compost metagenome]
MTASSAADHDLLNGDTHLGLGIEDLPEPIANPANSGNIQSHQVIEVAFHTQPGNHGTGMRIGKRGAVTKELGNHMQTIGEFCRFRRRNHFGQRQIGQQGWQ